MKVFITGATGFLGRYAAREFYNKGYDMVLSGRNEGRLKKLQARYGCEIVTTDLSNIKDISTDADFVVHCAALSTVWGRWEDFYNINVKGTENVIDFCKRNNIKRLVYVSSPSVYTEERDRFNIKEDNFNIHNELNFYIKSKILAENTVKKAEGLETVILRPRALFGIGDTSIIPRLIKANRTIGIPLFNEGKNIVDITCVENVAYALRKACEEERAAGGVYNITNIEPCQFKGILERLFARLGEKAVYRKLPFKVFLCIAAVLEYVYKFFKIYKEPPITRYTVMTLGFSQSLDCEAAKRDLNYTPQISIEEGINKYARYMRELKKRK